MNEKTQITEPPKPSNSFRITLELSEARARLDQKLMEALRAQDRSPKLKVISRSAFKDLFKNKKIQIKGQNALPSSSLSRGTTFVDILGYKDGE